MRETALKCSKACHELDMNVLKNVLYHAPIILKFYALLIYSCITHDGIIPAFECNFPSKQIFPFESDHSSDGGLIPH